MTTPSHLKAIHRHKHLCDQLIYRRILLGNLLAPTSCLCMIISKCDSVVRSTQFCMYLEFLLHAMCKNHLADQLSPPPPPQHTNTHTVHTELEQHRSHEQTVGQRRVREIMICDRYYSESYGLAKKHWVPSVALH